jgi:hypothetical protein
VAGTQFNLLRFLPGHIQLARGRSVPVNFPVENCRLLTQREILYRARCSGDDQAPDEQKGSGDKDHKCEVSHRKKDESDDRAEWVMLSLTATIEIQKSKFTNRGNQR